MDYKPVKTKYVSTSEQTNNLLKRKRILEFSGASPEEWLSLADGFLADGGRANYTYCIWRYRRQGGDNTPVEFDYVPEPEIPATDYTDF